MSTATIGAGVKHCTKCGVSENLPRRPLHDLGRDQTEGVNIYVCPECADAVRKATSAEPHFGSGVRHCGNCGRSEDTLAASGRTLGSLGRDDDGGVHLVCSQCVREGGVKFFNVGKAGLLAAIIALFIGLCAFAVHRSGTLGQ